MWVPPTRSNNMKKHTTSQIDSAARRKEHFARGGTPAMWRGRAATLDQKNKARASKRACRGRVRRSDWS